MKAIQLISQDVFDKIRSRFENLEMGDETGAVTIDPTEARFFDFDFIYEGNNLGRVSISLNDLGSLKIYYSQGITENVDEPAKQIWYKFLKEMRMFAMRRLMRFDTRDIAKTNLDKNDFQYLANKGNKEATAVSESNYVISDFKLNVFESFKDYRKWMRSPKTKDQGMTRYSADRYENIFIDDRLIENQSFATKKQEAKIFSNKFKNLDQRENVKIKVGNAISLLSSTLVPDDGKGRLEISGFVNPKEITKLNLDIGGKIDSIEFSDGSRFPEAAEFTTIGGISITNTIFFPTKQSASKAYTNIWMMVNYLEGKGWEIENYMSESKIQKNAIKDTKMTQMNESRWNARNTKKTSRAVRGTTEVIVRHARPVDEMFPGSRSQKKNIKAIFIQNKDGERFKYPFIHPAGAFAMAQHVDHGGVPHDPAGKAIMRMSEQIAQLQEFGRQVQHSQLHDDAMGIAQRAHGRLSELKSMIEALSKGHHYESWVAEFNEQEQLDDDLMELDPVTMEDYKSKFTQTNFKEELAQYFPLIHKIMQETDAINLEDYVQEEKEECTCTDEGKDSDCPVHGKGVDESVNEFAQFEEWAEAVEQGKLTDDQITGLKAALTNLSEPLQLGPEGTVATQFFQEFGLDDSDLADKFKQAADLDPTTDPMNIFQLWANENYPELLVSLGMSGTAQGQEPEAPAPVEEPAPAENTDMQMNPGVMEGADRKAMVQEVAKIVKQFYNRDNPEVGPFRGNEGIAIDVEKQISEMFGEEAGQQAKAMAEAFMEKLTMEWQERHGKTAGVADDGLARLKELANIIKTKVEGIGDQGEGGEDFNKNIMSAEDGPDMDKIPAYIRKQKQQSQDTAQQSTDKRNQQAGAKVWSNPRLPKESAEMESILKLAGLAK